MIKGNSMKSDESYIKSRVGKENPFSVPDNYFGALQQSLLDAAGIGEHAESNVEATHERHMWWSRCRRYVAVACAVSAVACGVSYWAASGGDSHRAQPVGAYAGQQVSAATAQQSITEDEIDYTMLDNDDIYSLVASN